MIERRVVTVVVVVVSLFALSGCYGPVTTTGIDVTLSCEIHATGQPSIDEGTQVVHVTLDAPEWSNPGATFLLSNVTATGFDSRITIHTWDFAQVLVTISGLYAFSTSVDWPTEPMFPVFTWRANDGFARLGYGTDFGSSGTTAIAPQHGTATVDLKEIDFLANTAPPARLPLNVVEACTPQPGQPTRLATIGMRGDHNY